MATFSHLPSGKWRAQVRRAGLYRNATFTKKRDAEAWAAIHHGGKDAARGPRGHSSLKAAADVELLVEREGDLRTVTLAKSRDGADGDVLMTFKLRPVDLGPATDVDPEADPDERLSSCIVEPIGGPVRKSPRPPKGSDMALRALREAISEYGERIPATSAIPPGVNAVGLSRWRSRFYVVEPLDLEDGASEAARTKASDARLKRFGRIRSALQDAGMIGVANNWVWLSGAA